MVYTLTETHRQRQIETDTQTETDEREREGGGGGGGGASRWTVRHIARQRRIARQHCFFFFFLGDLSHGHIAPSNLPVIP